MEEVKPVLIVGGSGVVGSKAAAILRRFQPDLPIVIGGRSLEDAEKVAASLGKARAVQINTESPDLGLPEQDRYGAVVVFFKDNNLNVLRFAQNRGCAYMSISTALFEIGPEVAQYIRARSASPVLLGTTWLVGAATLPALRTAAQFDTVDTIHIGAIVDNRDMGGPAAEADFDRHMKAAPYSPILQNGHWVWATGSNAQREFAAADGEQVTGQAYSLLDLPALAEATGARSVRFDLASRAAPLPGPNPTTEIVIEMAGTRNGKLARARVDISHSEGQVVVTATGVAVSLERLLGLVGGGPVKAGLYLASNLIDPAYYMQRLEEMGAYINVKLSEA